MGNHKKLKNSKKRVLKPAFYQDLARLCPPPLRPINRAFLISKDGRDDRI